MYQKGSFHMCRKNETLKKILVKPRLSIPLEKIKLGYLLYSIPYHKLQCGKLAGVSLVDDSKMFLGIYPGRGGLPSQTSCQDPCSSCHHFTELLEIPPSKKTGEPN